MRTTKRRTLLLVAGFATALLGGGCNNTAASATVTTETFTGTLGAGGVDSHSFTVTNDGNVSLILTDLEPQTTITVGLGIGQPVTGGCSLLSTSETTRIGSGLSGTLTAGLYCVSVYDIGNVQGTDSYTLTVSHP